MQSDDSPQTVHFVPPPKELALLKSLARQLALDHTVALSHTPPYRLGPRLGHPCSPHSHDLPPSEPLSSSCIRLAATRNKQ